ncbi:MAG TPA: C40 family peptidase [Actinomycetota bacterium]|nr:C40 family peptidase [Actinomycetota bacterium]
MRSGTNSLRRVPAVLLVAVLLAAGIAVPARAAYSDVPADHWAAEAIRVVAEEQDWMRLEGELFRPADVLLRRELARGIVRAFAPDHQPDPGTTFSDLPVDDPDFPYANIAVKLGWMVAPNGVFAPEVAVSKRVAARALVYALGLQREVSSLNAIKMTNGTRFARLSDFGVLVVAGQLRLFYNHPTPNEAPELLPQTALRRADAAYSLYRASAARGTWLIPWVQRYRGITLPVMTPTASSALEFGFRYAGYPYIYAGEWYRKTSKSFCCGAQPQGGFDCSGFTWWVARAPVSGWDNSAVRPYPGWGLPERSSRAMAKATAKRIAYEAVAPLDLVFFDTDGRGVDADAVDHVGIALGNGWMLHSSGSRGGVTIEWIGDGWWRARYLWARRVAA